MTTYSATGSVWKTLPETLPPTSPEIRAAHWRIYFATGSRTALALATREDD